MMQERGDESEEVWKKTMMEVRGVFEGYQRNPPRRQGKQDERERGRRDEGESGAVNSERR